MRYPQRTCYVHIGSHKTGTTSIQRFLSDNRTRLQARGVFFPQAGTNGEQSYVCHHQLALDLADSPAFVRDRGGLDEIINELSTTNARIACISSEDLSFLAHHRAGLIRLRDAFRSTDFRVHIVVFLRPQGSYLSSVYAEAVRHGYRTSFDQYLSDIHERGFYVWQNGYGPPCDYGQLLDRFASVFGDESVTALRYRSRAPDSAVIVDFLRCLLSAEIGPSDFDFPTTRENQSLNFGNVLSLLGSKTQIEPELPFWPFNVGQLLLLQARFRSSNARLRERFSLDLPVFEPHDLLAALPIRRTGTRTRQLVNARRALSSAASDDNPSRFSSANLAQP